MGEVEQTCRETREEGAGLCTEIGRRVYELVLQLVCDRREDYGLLQASPQPNRVVIIRPINFLLRVWFCCLIRAPFSDLLILVLLPP